MIAWANLVGVVVSSATKGIVGVGGTSNADGATPEEAEIDWFLEAASEGA